MKDFSFDRVYRVTFNLTATEIIEKIIYDGDIDEDSSRDDYAEWIRDTVKELSEECNYAGEAFADLDEAIDEWLDENMEELTRMVREGLKDRGW